MFKRLALVVLASLNLAAMTGCGHSPLTPVTGLQRPTSAHTVMAGGQERKLGFDIDRYQRVQAPKAHFKQVAPVQGLAPGRIDLRAACSAVADQGDIGSCTAFAIGKGMREYLQSSHSEAKTPLSALFLYYETRRLRNTVNLDSGATITDAMTTVSSVGVSTEASWPYDIDVFTKKPSAAAYKAAPGWKVTTSAQLAGLEDVKKALARKQPVVLGMRIYQNFRDVGADGVLSVPQNGDIMVGGHAVMVAGYDNKRQVLIVKNSFGTAWGDHGYFYMPYAYFTPDNVMDIWTAS